MEKLKDDALVGTSVRLVNEYDFPYQEGFDGKTVGKTVEVPQVHFIYKNAVDISFIVPVFQNVQEIVAVPKSQRVDRIFDVKAMLQFQVPTSHVVHQGHTSVLVSSLQGARVCCFKPIQQMLFQWCCKAKHYLSQQFRSS